MEGAARHINYQRDISATLLNNIRSQHGSIAQLKSTFSAAALGMFTSGWVWLVTDRDGNLAVVPTFGPGSLLVRSRRYMLDEASLLGVDGHIRGHWDSQNPVERNDSYAREHLAEMIAYNPETAKEFFQSPDYLVPDEEMQDRLLESELARYLEDPEVSEEDKVKAREQWQAIQEEKDEEWIDEGTEGEADPEALADFLKPDEELTALLRDPEALSKLVEQHPELEDVLDDVPAMLDILETASKRKAIENEIFSRDYPSLEETETTGEAESTGLEDWEDTHADRAPYEFEDVSSSDKPTKPPGSSSTPSGTRSFHSSARALEIFAPGAQAGVQTPSPYDAPATVTAKTPETRSGKRFEKYMGNTLYPLLCLSVHEHAWMSAGYGVWGKEEWIKEFWSVVDWEKVSKAYSHFSNKTG